LKCPILLLDLYENIKKIYNMNLEWLHPNTIYVTLHGSQCYGLSNELSDVDVKGICVPPREVEYNLFNRFEQAENNPQIEKALEHLKNPRNPKFESTLYSLRKFMVLAAGINPNIIEVLWTDPKDQYIFKKPMDRLVENRGLFLSSKAKYTFTGYSAAQLAKIERHRKWIVLGNVVEPKRENFNLPPVAARGIDEIFGYIKSKVEQWNLNQFSLEEMERSELKETIWELIYTLSQKEVSWDNWPDAYAQGVIRNLQSDLSLKDEVVELIQRERAYYKAVNNYKSWLRWKTERNPARRELEVRSGFDTKHALHLVRLLRMGCEIMTTGQVIVKRPDWEELLAIRNGEWSYEKVIEYSKEMQKKLDEVYAAQKKLIAEGKPTIVPWSVDFIKINSLYHELYEEYWK
jgi:predicted nucleotidyltransferase